MSRRILLWILRIIPVIILLQTLWFKFTGAPEAVQLFTTLGVEPWGRILVGIFELVTSIFLLVPSLTFIGALLATVQMTAAIILHLTVLGIGNDEGLLFGMAWIVFICSVLLLWLIRKNTRNSM